MKRGLAVTATGLVALAVAGCAAPSPRESASPTAMIAPERQVQILRERAAAFWAARMENDEKAEWELLEPRGKGRVTAREYASEHKSVRYLGYKVEDATIEGYFATVKVRVLFQPVLQRVSVPAQALLLDDYWIRVAGIWYRQLDDRRPPKPEP